MKKILLVILILLAIVGAFLYWNTSATQKGKDLPWNPFSWLAPASSTSSATSSLSLSVQEKLSGAGAAVAKGTQSAFSAAKDKVEESSGAVGNAISEGIGGFVDNLKESAKKKVAEALGLTPEETIQLVAADQLANLSICTTVKNPNITYVLQNPFSPPKDFSFAVDWGDGNTSQGSLRTNDPRTSTAHLYGKSGNYVNTFEITSDSQTITIRRKICVE